MTNHEQDLELIDQFLRGELDFGEREAIEKRMINELNFKQLVEQQKLLQQSFVRLEREKLWAKMEALNHDEEENTHISGSFLQRNWYWVMGAAASVAIVIWAGILWQQNQNQAEQVYLTYYKPVEELSFPVARGQSEAEDILQQATELYNSRKFNDCMVKLTAFNNRDDRHNYVLGLTLLELNQYEQALKTFDGISPESEDIDSVNWYKSLTLLALNRKDEAMALLAQLSEPPFPVRKLMLELTK